MKKLLFLAFACIASFAFAGQGGPDAYGYIWVDSNEPNGPTYAWYDNVNNGKGDPVLGLADDNVVGPFNFASDFTFYWYQVDEYYIGSNGYVIFNNTNIASPFPSTIPSSASGQGEDFVAALMSDLNFTGSGNNAQVWITTTSDSTIITYYDVPFWNVGAPGYTGTNTFQVIFNSADSSITVNYQFQSGITNGNDIAIGIENLTSTVGLQHSIDTYPPNNNYTIKYYYPQSTTYQVSDVGVQWTGNSESKGTFIPVSPTVPYTLQTNVSNSGNQPLGSFSVGADVKNSSGISVLTDAKSVGGLSLGQDTTLTFTQTFSPSSAGTYSYTTNTNLTGDATPTNNSEVQEIIAVNTAAPIVTLSYDDGGVSNGSIGWSGGNGGIGVYYKPPAYPAKILSTEYYITSNASAVSFSAAIFDDDGVNGGPGTLLDSVVVPSGSISLNAYTSVALSNPVTLQDGGFYVLWYMGGDGINLGYSTNTPISRQSYEVLGGSWAAYRDFESQDFLIKVNYEVDVPKDLAVARIIAPAPETILTTDQTVRTRVYNHSSVSVANFEVEYQLGSQNAVKETYSGSAIPPGDSANFTFATKISSGPGGNLCVRTVLSNDTNATNDEVCRVVYGLGIDNAAEMKSYFPNPSSGQLNFSQAGSYRIFTLDGKLVWADQVNRGQAIDLGYLSPGVYLIFDESGNPGKWIKY